jgi:hypothetical protein
MSREHARPQPPAGGRRYGGRAGEEPAPAAARPRCRSGSPATEPEPSGPGARGQVGKLEVGSWTPRARTTDHTPHTSPTQLITEPRTQGTRTAANTAGYRRLWPWPLGPRPSALCPLWASVLCPLSSVLCPLSSVLRSLVSGLIAQLVQSPKPKRKTKTQNPSPSGGSPRAAAGNRV